MFIHMCTYIHTFCNCKTFQQFKLKVQALANVTTQRIRFCTIKKSWAHFFSVRVCWIVSTTKLLAEEQEENWDNALGSPSLGLIAMPSWSSSNHLDLLKFALCEIEQAQKAFAIMNDQTNGESPVFTDNRTRSKIARKLKHQLPFSNYTRARQYSTSFTNINLVAIRYYDRRASEFRKI